MSHADFLWPSPTQKIMKKITFKNVTFYKSLTFLEKSDLMLLVESELDEKHMRKILLNQKKSFNLLMDVLGIEKDLVTNSQIQLVIKSELNSTEKKYLLKLIDKVVPEEYLIKVLSSLPKKRRVNLVKDMTEANKLLGTAYKVLNKKVVKARTEAEEIKGLFELYEICKETHYKGHGKKGLIDYINNLVKKIRNLLISRLAHLSVNRKLTLRKKANFDIKIIDEELLYLENIKKKLKIIHEQSEMDFGFEMVDIKNLMKKSKNNFEILQQLGKIHSSAKVALIKDSKSKALKNYIVKLNKEIETLIIEEIKTNLGDKFVITTNGKKTKKRIPDNLNIREVHGESIVFDFYVRKGKQEVTFNENELHEANHFFIVWVGDLLGFGDGERFSQIYALSIESLNSFVGKLYIYDSMLWDGTEVCGILNNQGDVILPPKYSQIERIGNSDYFKAYRLNINEGEDVNEGWEYYDKNGKSVNKEIIEKAEDKSYELELDRNYDAAKRLVWPQSELNKMKFIKQQKFSKAFETINEVKPLLEKKLNNYKSILRHPNVKHFIYKDLYVAYCDKNPKYKFVVGIDPDMNEFFDNQSE